jgi:alcohol dehydrogenase (NADP+)
MANIPTRTSVTSSLVAGVRETQDMLDLCARQNIRLQITKIPPRDIDDAGTKVAAKLARYRFVVDLTSEA